MDGGPRCRTAFFVDARSERLGLFLTIQSRYVESHGVRVGMATATAERLLRRVVHVGCEADVFLDSPEATLTVAFTGGTIRHNGTLSGGHVAALVLHGAHDDPGSSSACDVETRSEDVKTREDLAVFIRGLRADLAVHAEQWENPNLDRYLEALASVIEDLEGRFMNRGETVPSEPSWRLIAELLDAATVHE